MKIAVTGGAGFIGGHLVAALLREGHQVWAYDNFFAGHRADHLSWQKQATLVEGDILDFDRLSTSLRQFKPELIFHLAAIHYIPYCNDHPAETVRVNVEGTVNLMRAAQKCEGLKGIFFASSAAVYDTTSAFHKETDPPAPADIYGLSKVLGERVVRHYAAESSLSYVMGRFFNVYGPDETNPHVIPAVLKQVMDGGKVRMGRTDTFRDFIYVDDLVQALIKIGALLSSGKQVAEVYNLGSGQESSIASVVEILGKAARVNLTVTTEERHVRPSDRQHLRADIGKARRELGWAPAFSIARGLEQIVKVETAQLIGARSGK
ncbi:MAG TPA: GDP-mannose 4,6-dehydratase [Candidatus Angelobacter sp.]|jgi:UDP-glucose 4-epimerase